MFNTRDSYPVQLTVKPLCKWKALCCAFCRVCFPANWRELVQGVPWGQGLGRVPEEHKLGFSA